jgi:hypothetical protein
MPTASYENSVLDDGLIEHPEKIGIGTWDKDNQGTALNDVNKAQLGWYYNWQESPLWDSDSTPEKATFVPMVWDETDVKGLTNLPSSADTLLGFNEPDNVTQANMSVDQALALWPELMATGMRLGSPAPTTNQALGENSWLGKFMSQADAKGYDVDFVAVHYYPTTNDVGDFKAYLEAVHEQYGRPIWVTEWALADWNNPDRFSADQQADFARQAIQMMDDLPFVERNAWFAAYSGGDGWDLSSECFGPNGELTPVGQALLECTEGTSGAGTTAPGSTTPSTTTPGETLTGTSGNDVLNGSAGADTISGLAGNDRIDGKEGADILIGGQGKDTFLFTTALGSTNVDTIKDFNPYDDVFNLSHEVFSALDTGKLNKKEFVIGSEAEDGNDHIIYDNTHGALYYDPDGNGDQAAVHFATLSPDMRITASDFIGI